MRVAVMLVLLVLSAISAGAQDNGRASRLAIRFQLRDDLASFVPIEGSRGAVGFTVSPLQTKDHQYSRLISMINLSADRRGDAWQLEVSVTLPSEEKVMLVSQLVKVGESIKVEKFTDYELLPSEVGIVHIEALPASAPEVVNKTTSIGFEITNPKLIPSFYRLTFANNSRKNVYGMLVVSTGGIPERSEAWLKGYCGQTLIEAGGKYQSHDPSVSDGDYKRIGENLYRPTQINRLELATVVLTDGSYEGESRYAAILNAEIIGARNQITRVLPLVERALDSNSSEAEVINTLRESINNLDAEIQPGDAEELRKRLDGLSEKTITDAGRSIGWGRSEVKTCVKRDLIDRNTTLSVHDWLLQEEEKLKMWSSRFN